MIWTYTTQAKDAPVQKSNLIHVEGMKRDRGEPKIIWDEVARKDLISRQYDIEASGMEQKVHVADPN